MDKGQKPEHLNTTADMLWSGLLAEKSLRTLDAVQIYYIKLNRETGLLNSYAGFILYSWMKRGKLDTEAGLLYSAEQGGRWRILVEAVFRLWTWWTDGKQSGPFWHTLSKLTHGLEERCTISLHLTWRFLLYIQGFLDPDSCIS